MSINTNLIWTIVGVFGGGLVSLIIALLTRKFSKKILVFRITTERYYSNDDTSFSFMENGSPIAEMNISHVKLHYRGNGLLMPTDFVTSQPLSLVDLDLRGRVYAVKNIRSFDITNVYPHYKIGPETNFLKIESVERHKAELKFEYFDSKRSVEFLVFHNARLYIEGKLIDGLIKEQFNLLKKIRSHPWVAVLLLFLALIFFLMTLGALFG